MKIWRIYCFRVGTLAEKDEEDSPNSTGLYDRLKSNMRSRKKPPSITSLSDFETEREFRLTGVRLWWARFRALMIKRILFTKRRLVLYAVMVGIPVLFTLICQLQVIQLSGDTLEFEPRVMDLAQYTEPITFGGAQPGSDLSHELLDIFSNITSPDSSQFITAADGNISSTILSHVENTDHGIAEYRTKYVCAGDFSERIHRICDPESAQCRSDTQELTAVYNSVPNHARPLSQNLISNTLLTYLEDPNIGPRKITVTAHPMPLSNFYRFDMLVDGYISPWVFAYGLSIGLGLSILTSSYIIFPLTERMTSAKHVQMMTGLNPATFWFANFVWDFLIYILAVGLVMAILLSMDIRQTFTSEGAAGTLFFILFLFALSGIPMSYFFSFTTKHPASGFALLIVLSILSGSIGTVLVWTLRIFGDLNDNKNLNIASECLRYVFTWFPPFPMTRAVMALVQIQEENTLCTTGVSPETLTAICTLFVDKPELLYSEQNREYAVCCKEPYVDEVYQVCDVDMSVGGFDIPVSVIEFATNA